MTVMASATIAPMLPRMADAFHDTPDVEFLSKLVLTMPALVITLWAPFAGAVIDRFGRTRFLRANLLLYALAGASGFVLSDLHHILIGRAFLGLAVAAVMTCVQALAGDYFAGPVRTRYVSIQSMFMSGGGLIFVTLGGLLAEVSWRAPFLVYLLALVSLVLVVIYLDEPVRAPPPRRDPADAGAATAASVWRSLPWSGIATVYSMQFFAMTMYYVVSTQLPFYLREIGVHSSLMAGLAIACASGVSMLSTLRFARLLRATSHVTVYAMGFCLMAAGFLFISLASGAPSVMLGASVTGLGMGLVFPNGSTWMLSLADPRVRGRLAGGLAAAIFLGQFTSPIIAEPFAARFGLSHLYFGGGVVLFAVAAGLAFLRLRQVRRQVAGNSTAEPAGASIVVEESPR